MSTFPAPPPLAHLLHQRILVLDGAMGTMLQRQGLTEEHYRGSRFHAHGKDLRGNHDVLCLTHPTAVAAVHDSYLEAGADIIETNTFSANGLSQADYHLEHVDVVQEMNAAAARLAKECAARWTERTPHKPRLVAGSIGPSNRTLSISPRVDDPSYRAVSFEQVKQAYVPQVRGLVQGGCDLLLVETIFDTLNAKACLVAIEEVFAETRVRLPVVLSVTVVDKSGRTLSGQTVDAFWTSVAHAQPAAVGLNCSLGALEMRPFLEELARSAPIPITCYPNAGMPNAFGGYDQPPDVTARLLKELAEAGLVNMVGGCCGTTPEHIRAIAAAVDGVKPRQPPLGDGLTRYSGLETLTLRPDSNFTLIGERTNVTGSSRFAEMIKKGDSQAALSVALDQVRGGANILDVNMDEGMLDSVRAMTTFLNLVATEPEVARLPIMIDSSRWDVIVAGLQCVQGKAIVNSISLKEGEADFLRKAEHLRRMGAATVVMAFDERGQADTVARKVEIGQRAYRLLTEQAGMNPEDIILDPAVLAVATGMEEHNAYALAFIEAVRLLKQTCPGAKTSGGISNLSFAFRGNNVVREAMHSAFLYHAIKAGLDMGIVNAGQIVLYEEIEPELLVRVEDVILNRRADATERLVELAQTLKGQGRKKEVDASWRRLPVEERLSHALVHGLMDHVAEDVEEAYAKLGSALTVIEGPLMDGMRTVGDLFGAGKMFLPQVVKSARVMKNAVAVLTPHMEANQQMRSSGRILMATVKGDVHDIGKNIVSVVLGCNGYQVIDLGVMVPTEKILDTAVAEKVDLIGLSGLITPSLDEMVHVAQEMDRRGLRIPLLIGGATTSRAHTAVKIAPAYPGPCVHVLDASRAVGVAASLVDDKQRDAFVARTREEQAQTRSAHEGRLQRTLVPLSVARTKRPAHSWSVEDVARPRFLGRRVLLQQPLEELAEYIDWTFFFTAWELKGRYPAILTHPQYGSAARELHANALALLQRIMANRSLTANGVYGFWPAASQGDDIILYVDETRSKELMRFNMLRQQLEKEDGKPYQCLADFVAPADSGVREHVGAFAVTAGVGVDALVREFQDAHDDYHAIMVKALADRLAEAFAEMLHAKARREWYAPDEALPNPDLIAEKFRGIRPAFGYPACPEHSEKRKLFDLLEAPQAGITLTDHFAMMPAASVSGLYLAHKEARYFLLGRIGQDQVEDYAARKGWTVEMAKKWLGPNL